MNYEPITGNCGPNTKKGLILITTLWMVAILAVFAVSIGRQSAISLKLTSYDIDKLKAYFIARAGIIRVLAEKRLEYKNNLSIGVDALSQPWANNTKLFDRHRFGDGSYTVGYEYPLPKKSDDIPVTLYGFMDEESKININTASDETISNLLLYFDIDEDDAMDIAGAIIDWRDMDNDVASSEDRLLYGAENTYYQGLLQGYDCKNSDFDTIYELLLVRGIAPRILNMIKPYITIFGSGKININSASEPVLSALIGPVFTNLPSKIANFRSGEDGLIGTSDDAWFSFGSTIIDRGKEGLVEIKNLQDAEWYANIYGITIDEYSRIRDLISGFDPQFSVTSDTYRAIVSAQVKKVKIKLEAVYSFKNKNRPPLIKYWYQE